MSVHQSVRPPLFKYVIPLTNHPISFLDASSHLYKRVCPSIGLSVGPSVSWSVCRPLFKYNVIPHIIFLDASSHLYKRVCPSVGLSVHRSVRLSIGRSVGRSVPHYLNTMLFHSNHPASFLNMSSHLYKRVCPSAFIREIPRD